MGNEEAVYQKSEPYKLDATRSLQPETRHLTPETQYSKIPSFQLSRFVCVAKAIFFAITSRSMVFMLE